MADMKISQLTAKATPVNADIIPILDSENNFTNKKASIIQMNSLDVTTTTGHKKLVIGNLSVPNTLSNYMSIPPTFVPKNATLQAKMGLQMAVYRYYQGAWTVKWTWTTDLKTMDVGYSAGVIIVFKGTGDYTLQVDTLDISDVLDYTTNGQTVDYSGFNVTTTSRALQSDITLTIGQISGDIIATSPLKGQNVLFCGDSITTGVNASIQYHTRLSQLCGGFASKTINAIAGSCISDTGNAGAAYTPLTQRLSELPTDVDLIVVFMGTNDYGKDSIYGTIADTTDVSFYGALNVCLTYFQTNMPSARVVFMTPIHRGNDRTANAKGKTLLDYVNAIKEECAMFGVPVIDTYSMSGLNPNVDANNTLYFVGSLSDRLHPNNTGQYTLAKRILPYLEMLARG